MVEIHITKPEQVLGFPQKRLVGPPEDRKFIAPSKAWERGIPNERMKPFERNPTGESPVRLEP